MNWGCGQKKWFTTPLLRELLPKVNTKVFANRKEQP